MSRHGDRKRCCEQSRTRDEPRQRRAEEEDPARCEYRQLKGQGTHQGRVEQNQAGDRQRQDPPTRRLTPQASGHRGQPGHGSGPQHRGFEAGDGCEEQQAKRYYEQPPPRAEATGSRSEQSDHESHVLTRNGQQVCETGGPEVVGGDHRLVAVIAVDETGEQGPSTDAETGGPGLDQPSEAIGDVVVKGTAGPGADVIEREPTLDATTFRPLRCVRQSLDAAPDLDGLTSESFPQARCLWPPRPHLDESSVHPRVEPQPRSSRFGIGCEPDLPYDSAGGKHRPLRRSRACRQERGQQGGQ